MERAHQPVAAQACVPAVLRRVAHTAHIGVVPPSSASRRMPTNDELHAWVHAVGTAADRTAFAALFRHFAPRIKGFLVRSGSSDALAEEITQETMVTLWRRAATFDPQRAQLSTWLYTVARNLRIDHHRRHGAGDAGPSLELRQDSADTPPWDADQPAADARLAPDEQLLALQRERGVREALAGLPAEQALVLRLSFFEERPHARIAEELGLPLGTVKSRIRLAVAQLRRLLDGFQP
jgi:RNA polymerase sigma-70 factor (ECF subfamily)